MNIYYNFMVLLTDIQSQIEKLLDEEFDSEEQLEFKYFLAKIILLHGIL